MRSTPTNHDEIDAVLGDDVVDADMSLLAAVVHDIRSEYRIPEPLQRSEELLAFTGSVSTPVTAPSTSTEPILLGRRVRRRGLQAAGVGLAGKVLLGTTLAAASVGGLGAAGVVELPSLPDQAADQAVAVRSPVAPPEKAAEDDADTADAPEEPDATEAAGPPADVPGAAASEAAQMKRGFAAEFVAAKVEWTACAQGLPAAEKEAACGERPHPSDFGVTDPPGQAVAAEHRPAHAGDPDHLRSPGPPDDLPTTAADNAPATPGNGGRPG